MTLPTRANIPPKRAATGQEEVHSRSELDLKIEEKKAELAALQERASAVEVAAEPSKLCHKNCTSFNSHLSRGQAQSG